MSFLFYHHSTWLCIELVATSALVVLNLVIPVLTALASYRNIINFYFASAALSSSLLNCLYIYYLVQTLRSKTLSENNCRAIYYLQTSCTVVLAYTIVAMHANFVLCLLSSSSSSSSSDQHGSIRACLHSCGLCLRRFFRRFCFCLVLCVWSLSFTATIPLLYTIDSNEKTPKPVYCPGTTQVSYTEEWFDRNRLVQTAIFHLIPLLIGLFLSIIALLKLLYDCLAYCWSRVTICKCWPHRRISYYEAHSQQQQQQEIIPMPYSMSMLSSLGMISNSHTLGGTQSRVAESPTPPSETTVSSSNPLPHSCAHWCSTSFLRFLLVFSCCLLACIYPIAMRFYLVYFSVLVPLIFAVLNYSLGQLTATHGTSLSSSNAAAAAKTITMSVTAATSTSPTHPSRAANRSKILETPSSPINIANNSENKNNYGTPMKSVQRRRLPLRRERISLNEQFELQSPLSRSLLSEQEGIDEQDRFIASPSSSSQSSTIPITLISEAQPNRSSIVGKQKYFSNNLYEHYNRNILMR